MQPMRPVLWALQASMILTFGKRVGSLWPMRDLSNIQPPPWLKESFCAGTGRFLRSRCQVILCLGYRL